MEMEEAIMESNYGIDVVSPEGINQEIQRRALAMAKIDAAMHSAEDALTVASRQVFEELLTRFAGKKRVS